MPHSPTPWVFKEADGDEIIEDANGHRVHYDTQYYPSGLDSDDARFIVSSVNRAAKLEALLREIDAKIVFETAVSDGTGNDLQRRVEVALGIRTE